MAPARLRFPMKPLGHIVSETSSIGTRGRDDTPRTDDVAVLCLNLNSVAILSVDTRGAKRTNIDTNITGDAGNDSRTAISKLCGNNQIKKRKPCWT